MIRRMARTAVIAATATSVANRVSRRQHDRWAEQTPQTTATTPTADGIGDKLAQLQQLGDLKERGILTDEEFNAQKQTILGA